jgi:hypothetical protein
VELVDFAVPDGPLSTKRPGQANRQREASAVQTGLCLPQCVVHGPPSGLDWAGRSPAWALEMDGGHEGGVTAEFGRHGTMQQRRLCR